MSVSSMDELFEADAKFNKYLKNWAKGNGKTFEIESFDGRETLFDGMAVADVWGWLLDTPDSERTDENYGCVEWSIDGNNLTLTWNDYE